MKKMLDFALMYHDKGLQVLPVNIYVDSKTGDLIKKPYVKFADKHFNRDEVVEMWERFPTASIGIRTDKFFIVDIDINHNPNENGYETLKNYEKKHLLIPTLEQETASGGKQLIYFKRDDIAITQRIGWLKGIDVKAHPNNFFIAPPSVTPYGQYKWLNPKQPIVTPPRELIAEIMRGNESNDFNARNYGNNRGKRTPSTELIEMIAEGLGDIGGRNNAVTRLIGYLFYRGVDLECVYNLAMIANRNTLDPLSDKEIENAFRSIYAKEMRK